MPGHGLTVFAESNPGYYFPTWQNRTIYFGPGGQELCFTHLSNTSSMGMVYCAVKQYFFSNLMSPS